ncbi:hypothetical protein ES703_54155 [subsurface metagenome]
MNAYWYKIKSKSGIVGWSYGYFIDTDEQYLAAIFSHLLLILIIFI